MIKGLDKTINNLKSFKNIVNSELTYKFINESLQWIANKANENLDNRTSHFWGSDARDWSITITGNVGRLENKDPNSGAIEFGIGVVGESEPHRLASENGYEYNVNGKLHWTFKDKRTGIWVHNFSGYEGKSFLYDAVIEYRDSKIYNKIYTHCYNSVMNRHFKKV